MKNKLLFIPLIFFTFITVNAQRYNQDTDRKEQLERVQAVKVGFLTDKIKLTEAQAEKFWPLYNVHSDQRREIFKEIRRKIRTGKEEGISAEEKSKLLDETMLLKEKDLVLQKEFKKKILNVISVDQYLELVSGEREFNKLLMDRLGKRKKPN